MSFLYNSISGLKGNPEQDFIEANHDLKYISQVVDAYKKFGTEEASKIIWALLLVNHPGSQLFNAPLEEKRRDVETNYLGHSLEWDDYSELNESLLNYTMPKGMRDYKVWRDKYDELTRYIETLNFKSDSKELLTWFEKGEKCYATLKKMESLMLSSVSADGIKGGGDLSERERRRKGMGSKNE